jgi:hypothetical protein
MRQLSVPDALALAEALRLLNAKKAEGIQEPLLS